MNKLPWYFKNSILVIAFLSAGPLVLPLIWFHPKMSGRQKILWTVVTIVLSYFLVLWTLDSIKKLEEYYQQLKAVI